MLNGRRRVAVVVKTFWDPILVGRCTTHFRSYFSGDWDVHWGYGILTKGHVGNRGVDRFLRCQENFLLKK